jgi:hypothetical protein
MTGQVWDQYGARDGLVIDRDGREEGACASEGDAVAEESSDSVEREGGGVHVLGGLADLVVHVQGVQASKLPQGDVFDQVVSFDGHVERPWPSRGPEQGSELVLVVRLCHEHLSPAKAAAYHA